MSSGGASVLLSDCVVSPPPDRLLYWLLQWCSFDELSSTRSELRQLLFDASEAQLQVDVERTAAERAGGGGGVASSGSSAARHALYKQLSARRDAAMAAVDAEVALRVRLRQLYRNVAQCSYEHAMGLSTWVAELREECEAAGLPLASTSSLFLLQLAAIGNAAVRAADRPRTTKAEFDQLMKHLMTYAEVTQPASTQKATARSSVSKRDVEQQHRALDELQQTAAEYWLLVRQPGRRGGDDSNKQRTRDAYTDERVLDAVGRVVSEVLEARSLDSPLLTKLFRVYTRPEHRDKQQSSQRDRATDAETRQEDEDDSQSVGEDVAVGPRASAPHSPAVPSHSAARLGAKGRGVPSSSARSSPKQQQLGRDDSSPQAPTTTATRARLNQSRLLLNEHRGEDPLQESEQIARRAMNGTQQRGKRTRAAHRKAQEEAQDGEDGDDAGEEQEEDVQQQKQQEEEEGDKHESAEELLDADDHELHSTAANTSSTRTRRGGRGRNLHARRATRSSTAKPASDEVVEDEEDGELDDVVQASARRGTRASSMRSTSRDGQLGQSKGATRKKKQGKAPRGKKDSDNVESEDAEKEDPAAAEEDAAASDAGEEHSDDNDSRPKRKRQRRNWTDAETRALVAGMDKYATHWNKWQMIKEEYSAELAGRTPENLKDRWRVVRTQASSSSSGKSTSTQRKQQKRKTQRRRVSKAGSTGDEDEEEEESVDGEDAESDIVEEEDIVEEVEEDDGEKDDTAVRTAQEQSDKRHGDVEAASV